MSTKLRNSGWIVFFLTLAIAAAGLWASRWFGLLLTWGIIAVLMLVIIIVIGVSLGKGGKGILIDPMTNMMSLSRLQVVLWTWVILSAFISLALVRIGDSILHPNDYKCSPPATGQEATCADPIAIQLPPLLWALMGISLTSAVGAPLLKVAKAQRTTDQSQENVDRARKRGAAPASAETYQAVLTRRLADNDGLKKEIGEEKPLGAVVRKDSPSKADFSDFFTGEEVSTFGYVDIAKVQNMFFTLVVVVSYVVALAAVMYTPNIAQLFTFPDPPSGLVALIGISHAGYLVDKSTTHSSPEATTTDI
jgi:hypothetical protein